MRSLSGSLVIVASRVNRWYCSRSVRDGQWWLSALNGLFVYWLCTGCSTGASHDKTAACLSGFTWGQGERSALHRARLLSGPC